jgi:linoleoyl-CoA desaturase
MPATVVERIATPSDSVPLLLNPSAAEIRLARRRLHAKATFVCVVGVASYWGLVFGPFGLWGALACAAVLVLMLVVTASSIMHDANHASFSSHRWLNQLAACSSDVLGASGWVWRFKHNHLHHGNPNVVGMDADIDQPPVARLAPAQPWKPWHRYQHVYLWFLYGFLAIRWFVMTDLRDMLRGGIGPHPFPRPPRRRDVARLIAGKLVHATWALVIPLMFHPWWVVLTFYVVCSWVVGFVLAVTFQLAHAVDLADFASIDAPRRGADFARHQVETTVDIRCRTRVGAACLAFITGGLDHQVEHHLAPRLPHPIYRTLARDLEDAAAEAGYPVRAHATPWAALRSHGRWLQAMGRRPAATATA